MSCVRLLTRSLDRASVQSRRRRPKRMDAVVLGEIGERLARHRGFAQQLAAAVVERDVDGGARVAEVSKPPVTGYGKVEEPVEVIPSDVLKEPMTEIKFSLRFMTSH